MDKKLIYGTFSTITILIVIAVLVFVNLIADKLDIKADLTTNNTYTISDKSIEVLQKIDKDVSLYVLSATGKEDNIIGEILNQYKSNSSKITIEYKDPYVYPTFAKQFSETESDDIENDSIIVQCGDKHRVISPNDLYERQIDYTTGSYKTTGISAESEITNAISFVSMEKTPIIYYVSGHNEGSVSETLKNQFGKMNYEIKTLNITKDGGIPEDCDILFMTTPKVDYSDDEANKIIEYLGNDGRAAIFLDWTDEMPNINKILQAYGVKMNNSMIMEGNKNNYYNGPMFVIPEVSDTDITKQLLQSDYPMIFPYAQGVDILDLKKNSLSIEALLKTSSSAYAKTSKDPKSINMEEGDLNGPFNLAVGITDSYFTDKNHTTKLVVCGSSLIIADEGMTPGSITFAMNIANWLKGEATSIYIPPKSLEQETIMIPEGTGSNITIFVCGVIPAIIFISGIIVWYKRRYV